jgi:DNA-binding response OmpR family regulator
MKTILVIDDNDDVRSIIVTTLKDSSFATLEAHSGAQGIELAKTGKPDLILCDVAMPDMDGFQTLASLRATPATSAVPVILMTGSTDRNGMRRGMACGADDFLVKPFRADELIEAVVSRLVRQTDLQWEAFQRAEKLRDEAMQQFSQELSVPINGILGAVTSMMVDYAAVNPAQATDTFRQINESATRLNQLTRPWAE